MIKIGLTAAATTIVDSTNTALNVGSGSLEVFGTPMMVALMEKAACNAIDGMLEEGQTTVGVSVSIAHTAASALGAVVEAIATITAIDGRKICYELVASDNNGEIGRGTHERFVIDAKKFLDRINSKK